MPTVHVVWLPRDTEVKRKVAARFTEVLMEEAKCSAEAVHIRFHDSPAENFADGGVLMSDMKK